MLVECCFVDDKDDVQLYDCQKMAEAIVYGITGQRAQASAGPEDQEAAAPGAETPTGGGNELLLVFDDTMAAGYFGREEERLQLEVAISEYTGRQVAVTIKENDVKRPLEDTHVDIEQVINMEITYEDE